MTQITKLKTGSKFEDMASYSRLVAVDNWIYVSNTAGRNPQTQVIPEDVIEQTHQVFANIEAALAAVDAETAVRRALYEQHGGYDVAFTRCHDYQIWTRLADTARFKKVDAILCHWRQHDESLSSAKTRAFEAKVVLDAFSRYPVSRLFPGLSDDDAGRGRPRRGGHCGGQQNCIGSN